MSNTDSILSVRSLTQKYGDMIALNSIDMDVRRGEFIALLGPSGCGKTTLLRCIGGFSEPTSGSIVIDGQDVTRLPAHRRPVNTVFQSYALFPHLSIADNIAYGPRRAGVGKKEISSRVQEALELVGLPHVAERYPGQLSGGQQQRIALARAIVNRPRLLLLDEPLGALDLKLRRQMQLELKRMQEKLGMTFLFVTHDQEEALVMADRVAVMNRGSIEQFGRGEQIYYSPVSPFVADFIGEANLVDVDVREGVVRLAGTQQIVTHIPDVAPGKYRLLARPEKLRVGAEGGEIRFSGVVTRRLFVGDALRMFVRLPSGAEISLKQSDDAGLAEIQPGAVIQLELAGGKPHLFPGEKQ